MKTRTYKSIGIALLSVHVLLHQSDPLLTICSFCSSHIALVQKRLMLLYSIRYFTLSKLILYARIGPVDLAQAFPFGDPVRGPQ